MDIFLLHWLCIILKKKKGEETVTFKGFEVPSIIKDKESGKEYPYRKFYIHSSQLEEQHMNTLEKKIATVTEELEEINKKLNHYKIYDNEEKIDKKIESILENKGLEEIINYTVEREVITQKKKVGRGRVTPNSKYTEVEKTLYNLKYSINEEKKLEYKNLCGYFILATNKPANELTMKEGLMACSYLKKGLKDKAAYYLKKAINIDKTWRVVALNEEFKEHIRDKAFYEIFKSEIHNTK